MSESTFSGVAYNGGKIRLAAWPQPVVVDLDGLEAGEVPLLRDHDITTDGQVGRVTARAEGGRLLVEGHIDSERGAAILEQLRAGGGWQLSIGAEAIEWQKIEIESKMVNGKAVSPPVIVVTRAKLREVSVIAVGADADSNIRLAASYTTGEKMNTDSNTVAADAVTAERARVTAIRGICAGEFPAIESEAISAGWSTADTSAKVLDAMRRARPAANIGLGAPATDATQRGEVIEAACAMTGKLANPEGHYSERVLDEAQKRFPRGIGLQEVLIEAASANGWSGRGFREPREILRAAFGGGEKIQATSSSIDIGGILSGLANKFLLEGFGSVERSWREVCTLRSVNDFKEVTSYRLVGAEQYQPVAPGGEIKHGTLAEERFRNRAETYGLMLSVDRRDIINDDLGALTTIPRKLGRGAALKINDVFWGTFLNNAAFFTAANGTLLTGAGSALGIDGLTRAEAAALAMNDSDGKPIGVTPAILLVPVGLSVLAAQLYKSLEMGDNTTNAKYLKANPHAGKYRVVVSRYLANAAYVGNSATAWYLLANPADLPVIEVALLDGNESPVIETAEADFDALGVRMRGYHDFGVALQDARGGIKSAGA